MRGWTGALFSWRIHTAVGVHPDTLTHNVSGTPTHTRSPIVLKGPPAYTSNAYKPTTTARSLPQLVPYTHHFQHPQTHVPT